MMISRKQFQAGTRRNRNRVLAVAMVSLFSGSAVLSGPEPLLAAPWSETGESADVIVTVNGTPITYQDVALAEQEQGAALASLPQETQFQYLVGMLVDRRILALKAEQDKMDQDPRVKRREAYFQEKAMRDVYWTDLLTSEISDDEVRKAYDEEIASKKPEEEVRASHILVNSKEEADEIIAKLNEGADFAELASEMSTGPSAAQGGDLGFFKKEEMVPEFADAAFALGKGEVSQPVKTQFGWHVIEVTDMREIDPPTFEEAKPQIISQLAREKGESVMQSLRSSAKIEFVPTAGGTSE